MQYFYKAKFIFCRMLLCIFKYIYIFSYKGNEKDYIIIYVHSSSNNSYFIFVKPGSFFGEI